MLANEREYRQEMNAILFPKDPFIKFRVAVDAYRNGLSVWIKMRNSDDDKVRELQQWVAASQQSFASARDGFLMWLSQRQDTIGQTRRALRSWSSKPTLRLLLRDRPDRCPLSGGNTDIPFQGHHDRFLTQLGRPAITNPPPKGLIRKK
jgi:hypothetical protein